MIFAVYYFTDESGLPNGPWKSEEAARQAEVEYGHYLNTGESDEALLKTLRPEDADLL